MNVSLRYSLFRMAKNYGIFERDNKDLCVRMIENFSNEIFRIYSSLYNVYYQFSSSKCVVARYGFKLFRSD